MTRISTARTSDRSQLVLVQVIEPSLYSFYGQLELSHADKQLDPTTWPEASVAVAPELLAQMGLSVGDDIQLANATYTIFATIDSLPGAALDGFRNAPVVLLSMDELERFRARRFWRPDQMAPEHCFTS